MTRKHYLAAGAALLVALILAFVVGRCSAPREVVAVMPPPESPKTRASLEEERERLAEVDRQIAELEDQHRDEIAAFDDASRAEYERVRDKGPAEVERWFSSFNDSLRER